MTHGVNGYLCENTVESIAQGIADALPMAGEVGLRARQTIPIPWNRLMEQVVARYRTLIERQTGGDCA